jgi:Flp pilus assembly protein TadG
MGEAMKRLRSQSPEHRAQTLVFFTLALGMICLLCGLAIDSGLLFLAKARLSRAVDGAALAAVGNFSLGNDRVAQVMRNVAVANYTDLGTSATGGISASATSVQGTYTLPSGLTGTTYTYNFNDGTTDTNGQFKRFVQVVLLAGSGGQITSATCNARCPVKTYFMGVAGHFFTDLKVSSSAVATRNPRLIMVVVDRSGSMLGAGGGAFGLPQAIVVFLNFFDTTSDNIGLVSFSSNARLEFPLTTNFLNAAVNSLTDSFNTNADLSGYPRPDPEAASANYNTTGVRRMKFGGSTSADEGIRLGMEQLEANAGWSNPDVVKYLVLFTDGAWNNVRTLVAAPGYTNVVKYPPTSGTNVVVSSADNPNFVLPVPTLSPMPGVSNALNWMSPSIVNPAVYSATPTTNTAYSGVTNGFDYFNHAHDFWQSADGTANEPLPTTGSPQTASNAAPVTITAGNYNFGNNGSGKAQFTCSLNVWVQPGAVDYVYDGTSSAPINTIVSQSQNPGLTTNITLSPGGSNVLVVPGYILDGTFTDSLDLPYPDDSSWGPNYWCFRADNYLMPYMWPDDGSSGGVSGVGNAAQSQYRQLMYRNYPNLLSGYYVYRADDPLEPESGTSGFEPLIMDYPQYPNGYPRPLHALGPYYPSAGFYWPFDLVGTDNSESNPLKDPSTDPSGTGDKRCRNLSWSINMSSPAAAPNWAGELFYKGNNGVNSVTTSASTLMGSKADWQAGIPTWITHAFDNSTCTTNESAHNTNLAVDVWRPQSLNGSGDTVSLGSISPTDGGNHTGGYIYDGTNYYRNAMAYSGRPTHFYDFSKSTWVSFTHNHDFAPGNAYPLCVWKAQEYAWHARDQSVTIYTVGYGNEVNNDECVLLAQLANATNVILTSPVGTSTNFVPASYNAKQPIGQQFYATTSDQISNDFYQIGTAINAALTQ